MAWSIDIRTVYGILKNAAFKFPNSAAYS
jgi:hypothetical protein